MYCVYVHVYMCEFEFGLVVVSVSPCVSVSQCVYVSVCVSKISDSCSVSASSGVL